MTIIRELVTLLRFENNESGLHQYEHALKGLAATIAGLFAAHEIMQLADEWATVAGRVLNVTNSVSEQTRVMDLLQTQAEKTGQSFEGIGSLFAQLKTTASGLGYSTDQVLQLTSAISQLTTLGGGTAAAGKRGMIQIEEMFSLGTVQMQHLKALIIDIPGAVDVIAASMKGGKKEFMEMVHAGTMTSQMFGDLFLKAQDDINRRFKNMPLTFARAMETVHSLFGRLIYDIGKDTGIWVTLAEMIVAFGQAFVDTVRWLAKEVGGYGNLLRVIAIGVAAAFGPGIVLMIGRLTKAMVALKWETIFAAAPWYLIAAAILLIGLAIDDVLAWMRGARSVTGDLIGDYSEWKDTIEGWKTAAIAAYRAVIVVIGDIGKEISTALTGHDKELADIKTAWLALFADNDPMKAFRDAIKTTKEEFAGIKKAVTDLFPSLKELGEKWSLGTFVHTTLEEVAAILRGLEKMITFLNRVHDWVNSTGEFAPAAALPMGPLAAAPSSPAVMTGHLAGLFGLPDADPSKMVAPGSLLPGNTTRNNNVTATINNNITTTADPAAVGAAAGTATENAVRDGFGRGLEMASPTPEFGQMW